MNLKSHATTRGPDQSGIALVLVMIMSAIAIAILASVMDWSSSSAKQTHSTIQYTRSVAAAEAATEKVVAQISHDFLYGGESLVTANLNSYRQNTLPTTADSPYWANWKFDDGNGNMGKTYVQASPGNIYQVLTGPYANLKGYVTTYTVVSHASDQASPQNVNAGVYQELKLTGIPIFQFAMFSSDDMEISCGQPFVVTGPVYSNQRLYAEPDSDLTFESSVDAVVDVLNKEREPLDTRGAPAGTLDYVQKPVSPAPFLTLPIGESNSPTAIRDIIEPPLAGEDATSQIGQLRYYNLCDMLVTVSDNGVTATSGNFNGFTTPITNVEVSLFISTNASFKDSREGKTVLPVDINVGYLSAWSVTNSSLRVALGTTPQTSIYVYDKRTFPAGYMGGVRVTNGMVLPTNGLTVATEDPLYVLGDYNVYNAADLGTNDTTYTRPASLVADAITILSDNWTDLNSTSLVGSRNALPTTVNAAFLTGVVETTLGQYSGGMENFPRFLETWGLANAFTYNGSMIKMFPSLHATGVWGQGNVYDPPKRNWAYDANFNDPTKLPPLTPSVLVVQRSRWSTVAPNNNVPTGYQ